MPKRKNKYVDFVSDEDFIQCVKWVCDSYEAPPDPSDMAAMQRNTIDPFKMLFDVFNSDVEPEDWLNQESIRQKDKTINNRIGEFHQKLLGKVAGWKDLGIGDESKTDLVKADRSIFIELKNKFNTMNSDGIDKCRDKLETAVNKHPKSVAYWAYIISRNGDSGEAVWTYGKRKRDGRIRIIWGKKVYELVTGDPDALEKTWRALPAAIRDLTPHKVAIGSDRLLEDVFRRAF